MTLAEPLLSTSLDISCNVCIALPLLHPETEVADFLSMSVASQVCHIWPGLPHMPEHFWQADSYPFSPKEAQMCLADLHAMGDAALSGVPLQALARMQSPHNAARALEETAARTLFQSTGQYVEDVSSVNSMMPNIAAVHTLRAAQKFLLWAWLLEERFREVRDLSEQYAQNAQHLVTALGVEGNDVLVGIERAESTLGHTLAPLPPWRLVLENVAVFLPTLCSIVVNYEEMASEVRENCDIQALTTAHQEVLGVQQGAECVTTIATILQSSKQQQANCPWLLKKVHCILLEKV